MKDSNISNTNVCWNTGLSVGVHHTCKYSEARNCVIAKIMATNPIFGHTIHFVESLSRYGTILPGSAFEQNTVKIFWFQKFCVDVPNACCKIMRGSDTALCLLRLNFRGCQGQQRQGRQKQSELGSSYQTQFFPGKADKTASNWPSKLLTEQESHALQWSPCRRGVWKLSEA